MENKKDFLKDFINMIKNEDKENCGEIVANTLNNYTKEIQDCVNDLGLNKFSAPFIAVALETVLESTKQATDLEDDWLYKELSKNKNYSVFEVTQNTRTGKIENIKTYEVNNKKSSDGDTENHTSED